MMIVGLLARDKGDGGDSVRWGSDDDDGVILDYLQAADLDDIELPPGGGPMKVRMCAEVA